MSEPQVYRVNRRKIKVVKGGNAIKHKLTKEQAGYVDPEPSIRCGTCMSYANKGDIESPCALVGGRVNANGCCNMWNKAGEIGSYKFASAKDCLEILFEN